MRTGGGNDRPHVHGPVHRMDLIKAIRQLAKTMLHQPVEVDVAPRNTTVDLTWSSTNATDCTNN